MTIPMELVAALVTVFGSAILAAIGFSYRKLSSIDVRLARIEERVDMQDL